MKKSFEKCFIKRFPNRSQNIDGQSCSRKIINILFLNNLEKKDLVELVLQHSQVSSPSDTSNSTHDDAGN